jgi:phytanoyl-CoA hydroxylase
MRSIDEAELIAHFRQEGVIRLRSLLSGSELREVRRAVERYGREVRPRLPTADFTCEADGVTIRNFWRMECHDSYFAELAAWPRITNLVRSLVNGPPVLMGVETFNKPARLGSAVPPHQDNAYFCQTPPDVLTVWIALDAATVENGAVEYALGSHRTLLPHAASGVKGNSFGLAEPLPAGRYPTFVGVLDAGDALLHHGLTVHWSSPNHSGHSRMSLVLVYRGAHTQTDFTRQEEYHRALALTPQNA